VDDVDILPDRFIALKINGDVIGAGRKIPELKIACRVSVGNHERLHGAFFEPYLNALIRLAVVRNDYFSADAVVFDAPPLLWRTVLAIKISACEATECQENSCFL